MTPERWDRIKCIGTITALMSFGILQACNKEPPKSEQQIQQDLKASSIKNQDRRQKMLDEASIVCRDGTAYLIGDDEQTNFRGGPFAVPYYRNGILMSCGSNSNQPAPAKKDV